MSTPEECVLFRKQGRIAIITLNIPSKLNAMNSDNYYRLSCLMGDVAKYVSAPPTSPATARKLSEHPLTKPPEWTTSASPS